MPPWKSVAITPSAARLTESLRDVGYDFPSAVADIVDNSVMAGALHIDVSIEFAGEDSYVAISDDGLGMTANGLVEALRYGSRRSYSRSDLGRYGLGLKTASLSQCRSVTVVTCRRSAPSNVNLRMLDLDLIAEWDEWLVVEPPAESVIQRSAERLASEPGTVVIWRKLDRVLPEKRADGGWARRRLEAMAAKTADHLGIVFHKYLEGIKGYQLVITVNGHKVEPWNPFAPSEPSTNELPLQRFEMSVGDVSGSVTLSRFVLPARDEFSTLEEFERYSGPLKWNRQQGIYIYRADRLVQWGGWNGIRGIDEHTKLARAALDFDTDLDAVFNINVAKMRVTLPPQIRQMLDRPINELCAYADDRYRKASRRVDRDHQAATSEPNSSSPEAPSAPMRSDVGIALRAAAMKAGEYEAFSRISAALGDIAPHIASSLGLSE
ncbi:MAG TPA: ATP-binding protein [Streptosporangiaceae bacterium]|nr:ATP-binding protein [Streptosporangiaceae bacterium]